MRVFIHVCNFQLILHVIRPYLVYNEEVFSYSIVVIFSSLIFFQTGRGKKIKYPCRAIATCACSNWARRENVYENVAIITRVSLC